VFLYLFINSTPSPFSKWQRLSGVPGKYFFDELADVVLPSLLPHSPAGSALRF
jgi:hypothetical protein